MTVREVKDFYTTEFPVHYRTKEPITFSLKDGTALTGVIGNVQLSLRFRKNAADSVKETCGVYMLLEPLSGMAYVGSSSRLKTRRINHRILLEKKTHNNEALGNLYGSVPSDRFRFKFFLIENRDLAYRFEQELIDILQAEGLALNISPFATPCDHGKLSWAKGAKLDLSDEERANRAERLRVIAKANSDGEHPRARQVSIKGVIYPSIRTAARAMGVDHKKIHRAVNDPASPQYFYTE